ncbi:MAG: DUF507 family protein [Deltaproteobacteria bacterium]|nr:DUF507 family protein [Deltaproteobacteria bacterium]MBW1928008.1 DUF507 family protein [Deltaproteobacteria bacterium]MBW2027344.1 DUF507 family protein [Deltaproteobacteria bacterium]MBW2124451.1 DUF507 family protein [Deltaproteobacteria bacterium]
MRRFDSGRVQDRLIRRLERKERQQAFQRDRFFRFKLTEIQNKLTQALLMNKIIETDNSAAVSELILQGLKKALKSSEFDFKYFIAPIRHLVPRPNPYSLYMTQYLMEVMINDPNVIDIYGTDQEIYKIINDVITQINLQFERTEEEVMAQMARNRSLIPGTREYEIALDQLFKQRLGEPQEI